jgi:hypothetical protein
MLTLDKANEVAATYLRELEGTSGTTLTIVGMHEESFGWIFFYQSKGYMETGSITAMLAGNAPFAVIRHSGIVEVLGTAKPVEFYLNEMRKKYGGESPVQ